ncbi:MAG TPA: hypothetical protein VE178_16865 [Silvibacterium sp.]|jgi:hypothetical protein|nr:hypothetical protein [Silvibacterium sp.]
MANQNGAVYGLTILSPIIDDDTAVPSHDLQIREYLASLRTDEESPFALTPGTHLARLVVMDDVIYVGMPACEEHLKSKYLIFESNLDGDLDSYLAGLAQGVPQHLDAIWSHCVGYPGAADTQAFTAYMKACQIETTFFFAAVNDKSVTQTLRALQTQRAVAEFIADHQGMPPQKLQKEFARFVEELNSHPAPLPGATAMTRKITTGGRNE